MTEKRSPKELPAEVFAAQQAFIEKIHTLNQARPTPLRAYTETFGCQQNVNDTERINGMLAAMGFAFTGEKEEADLILFNTCAVRENAEQKVFGTVGSLVHEKRRDPSKILALCGCMMQQAHMKDVIREKYRHVDLVFGPHALHRFPENLYRVMSEHIRLYDTDPSDGVIVEEMPILRGDTLKAWVSVMSGCNNFCSYCIVPYVRGRERSRRPSAVLEEVKELIAKGCKDITLLGQNVNSYCKDLGMDYDFADLIRDIDKIDGDYRIRFMTSHPKDATDKLFRTIAECKHAAKHIHLPFQSGNDRILGLMNRRYTRQQYLDLIRRAREIIPDVSFTSDVIVGYPTETETEFEDTLSLIREVGFDGLYMFLYSPRKGTPAAEMEQVDETVKGERFRRMLEMQNEISAARNAVFTGKTVRVLTEGVCAKDPSMMTGRTDDNRIVNFVPKEQTKAGDYADVSVNRTLNWALFGDEI